MDQIIPQDASQLDPKVVKVMKTIRQLETGGQQDPYNTVTPEGGNKYSHGAYQWLGNNFQTDAKQYGLDPNDFSPANQNKVAYAKILDYKNQGRTPEEIDALWNGAYKDPQTGLYMHKNPERAQKFRDAITAGGYGYVTPPGITADAQETAPQSIEDQRAEKIAQGEPVSVNPNKVNPTFAGSVIRGLINPFARVVQSVINPTQDINNPTDTGTKGLSGSYLGTVKRLPTPIDNPENPNILAGAGDVIGTGLELGSYGVGGGELGAGAKALSSAEKLARPLIGQGLKAAGEGAAVGALQGTGKALQEGKTPLEVAGSGLAGGLVGGVTGGTLGTAGGLIGRAINKPAVEQQFINKATQDMQSLVDESAIGIRSKVKPKFSDTVKNMIDEGFVPTPNKSGKLFDNTDSLNELRDTRITPLQIAKKEILTSHPEPIPTQSVLDSWTSTAKEAYKNDPVFLKEEVLPALEKKFKTVQDTYGDNLTAQDIQNIQNSESIKNFTKWQKAPDEVTQTKGKIARQMYFGTSNLLHKLDPRLTELDDTLSKYHGIEDLLTNLNGKKPPRGAQNWLVRLAAGHFGRATGIGVGGALGGIPGAIAGNEAEQGIVRAFEKTPFTKLSTKGATKLKQQGLDSVSGLIQGAQKLPKKKLSPL